MTMDDLKTFTFSAESKSRSIDNAVLGALPKRLLLTMMKNADFNGSVHTSPYKFRHYDSEISLYVNGKRVPSEGLTLDMDNGETSVKGYRTLFEVSGIHHSNTGLQITHDMHIDGYFILLLDLTPDRGASEVYTSFPENRNIRIELQFSKPLPESITCRLYLENDGTFLINFSSKFTTKF
jgi:hypothetical protein